MARPRTPLLSRQLITETALRVVDEQGLAELSMRKLARELRVQAPSLYSHYASKNELLDDVASEIMEAVDVSEFQSGDWRSALRTWARSYRAALTAHPNIVPFLAYGPSQRPVSLQRANEVHGGLTRAGWPPKTATMIGASVKYLVVGAAMSSFSSGFPDEASLYAERYPHLGQAHRLRKHADRIDEESFELALASLLAGLEERYERLGLRAAAR
jgi:AcrR family transcriptional regulator